jgi:hypothetical protein
MRKNSKNDNFDKANRREASLVSLSLLMGRFLKSDFRSAKFIPAAR